MKTLPIIAFLAALAAFLFAPLNIEITGSLLFAAGLLCILVEDYGQATRSLTRREPLAAFPYSARPAPAIGLAA